MEGLFIIVAIAALVIGIVVASIVAERKRTESLSKAAESLGLTFYPKGDSQLIAELECFRLFSKGRGKTITNVLSGEANGTRMGIFDYTYRTGGGKNSSTWRQTVGYFRSADLDLTDFAMSPENFFHRIAGSFGLQDIDFESHPVFSNAYLLGGADEEAIRRAFKGKALKFFEQHQGWNIEANGQQLIVFQVNQRTKPEQLRDFMREAYEVFAVFRNPDDATPSEEAPR